MDLHEYIYDAESALFGVHAIRTSTTTRSAGPTARSELLLEYARRAGPAREHADRDRLRPRRGLPRAGLSRDTRARSTGRRRRFPSCSCFPFRLDPGVVVKTRTQNVDVWPTLFDLLGLDAAGGDRRPLAAAGDPGERGGQAASTTASGPRSPTSTRPGRSGTCDPLPTIAVVRGPVPLRAHRATRRRADGRAALRRERRSRASCAIAPTSSRRRSSG